MGNPILILLVCMGKSISIKKLNSNLPSSDFCRLLINLQTVWTQIRTDRMSVLICIQTDCVPEIIFLKVNFLKVKQTTTKARNITQHATYLNVPVMAEASPIWKLSCCQT